MYFMFKVKGSIKYKREYCTDHKFIKIFKYQRPIKTKHNIENLGTNSYFNNVASTCRSNSKYIYVCVCV